MAKPKRASDGNAAVGVAFALTCVGELVQDMALAGALVPIVFLLILYAMWRWPLRDSMLGLMFLALIMQDPSDSCPIPTFYPPFGGSGAALLSHLNAAGRSLNVNWAAFSLMDLFLVSLLGIGLYRRSIKSKIDNVDWVAVPRPMIQLAYVALIGTGWTWLVGLATGGDFGKSLWQLNRVVYLPLIFIVSNMAFRGPKDLAPMLKVVLIAAVYKAFLSLYVVTAYVLPPDPNTGSTRPAWAISHQDSILFATAFVSVVTLVLERVGGMKKALRLAVLLIPIIGLGIWANNRRTAWVQVGLVFVTVFLLADDNPVKRKIMRMIMLAAPVIAIYVAIGWGGGGPLFKPVHTLRSVVDAKSDGSSNWRELENFNIRQTLKANPIFGTGYGHGYQEIIKLPEVGYDLEIYCPHNSLLGIWAYAGVVGYTMLTLLWVAGVYFATRAYRATRVPELRAAALSIIGATVVYLVQCWGDLGIGTWVGVFIAGPGFAIAGKLAVITGQWGGAKKVSKSVPAPPASFSQRPARGMPSAPPRGSV